MKWRTAATVAVLLCIGCGVVIANASAQGRALIEKHDLFVAGQGGYGLYHIPGILVTAKGTVLAWCEAREDGSDWDKIELLLRRSTDDGRTWSDSANISFVPSDAAKNASALKLSSADRGGITVNNPVMIADRDGTVHFLFCIEYQRAFYCRSGDDGVSWSRPVEITHSFRDFDYQANVLATGPNHGIQLRSGRLLVPVWLSTAEGNNAHHPSVTATIYSDDGGDSWHAGEIAVPNNADRTLDPNETTAIELADGTVMLNVRNHAPEHRRIVVTSPDGATGWSVPRFDPALLEPICMASLIRYPADADSDITRMLFSNPHNLFDTKDHSVAGSTRSAARRNLAVKLSYDEGRTWTFQKVVEDGPAMYSDLAVTPAGTVLCFYGRRLSKKGTTFAGDRLTVARCNLAWLTDGADPGRGSTAD